MWLYMKRLFASVMIGLCGCGCNCCCWVVGCVYVWLWVGSFSVVVMCIFVGGGSDCVVVNFRFCVLNVLLIVYVRICMCRYTVADANDS